MCEYFLGKQSIVCVYISNQIDIYVPPAARG